MKTIALADGSSIDLNTSTTVSVDLRRGKRAVRLTKGEAYFQVRHDPTRPFTVTVGNHRVTDLGTKFLVRDNKRTVQVSLIEGKAQLQSGDGPNARSVVLAPGDVAIASADALAVNRKSTGVLAEKLGWRHGTIVFDNATLGDAAAEFNRYNRVRLVIKDPGVASIPIAGKFPTNGVDRFADVIEHVFGLHIETKGATKVISR
jgi:transmembrane sensor